MLPVGTTSVWAAGRGKAKRHYAAGKRLLGQGKPKLALAKLLKAHNIASSRKIVVAVSASYDRLGDPQAARAFLEEVVRSGYPRKAVRWARGKLDEMSASEGAGVEPAAEPAAEPEPAPEPLGKAADRPPTAGEEGAQRSGPSADPVAPEPGVPGPAATAGLDAVEVSGPAEPVPEAGPAAGPAPAGDEGGAPAPVAQPTPEGGAPAPVAQPTPPPAPSPPPAAVPLQPAAGPEPAPPAADEPRAPRVLVWSAVGLAAVASAGTAALLFLADSEAEAANTCAGGADVPGGFCARATYERHRRSAELAEVSAFASLGVAAVAASTALALYLAMPGHAAVGRPTVRMGGAGWEIAF